jgi:hypothetical protein
MDFKALSAILAIAVTMVTVTSNAFGVLDKLVSVLRWMWRTVRRGAADGVPTKTLIVLVNPRITALYWGYAGTGTLPGMQVVGDFVVTNITAGPVQLPVGVLRYRQRRWDVARKSVHTSPLVKDLGSQYSGRYAIPPKGTTDVRIGFVYSEPERPPLENFVADVALVDQFGNHHWLRGLRFKHPTKMS